MSDFKKVSAVHIPVKEWDVYVNGKWRGTVFERYEHDARCNAISTFDLTEQDDLSGGSRR